MQAAEVRSQNNLLSGWSGHLQKCPDCSFRQETETVQPTKFKNSATVSNFMITNGLQIPDDNSSRTFTCVCVCVCVREREE